LRSRAEGSGFRGYRIAQVTVLMWDQSLKWRADFFGMATMAKLAALRIDEFNRGKGEKTLLGPYIRTMRRALWCVLGGRRFLMSEVVLYSLHLETATHPLSMTLFSAPLSHTHSLSDSLESPFISLTLSLSLSKVSGRRGCAGWMSSMRPPCCAPPTSGVCLHPIPYLGVISIQGEYRDSSPIRKCPSP